MAKIMSRPLSDKGREEYDRIFKKSCNLRCAYAWKCKQHDADSANCIAKQIVKEVRP
jgi:hypothetical protein